MTKKILAESELYFLRKFKIEPAESISRKLSQISVYLFKKIDQDYNTKKRCKQNNLINN